MPRSSGIYLFYRVNEEGQNCVYVGQAKDLLYRTAQHLGVGAKKTHIDKSLFKHKLYSDKNPHGWKVCVLKVCPTKDLDSIEQQYIDYYKNRDDVKMYNVTGGGQIDKKGDIGERLQTKLKSYKNGKGLGYEKAIEEVRVFFEKYLDYSIKGKPNKIKQRKLAEFGKLIEDKKEGGE